jgi:tRNA (cytidine32/uridine32-2'-O)-methyltransferase
MAGIRFHLTRKRSAQFNISPMNTFASIANDIRFVLVGTQHPGNIGAAARALKTMGLSQLTLVAPEQFPADEAYRRAAGADDVLAAASIVPDLATAVADCRFVLGCTARSRRVRLEEHAPRDAAQCLLTLSAEGPVALVFGRERTGLFNEELQLCHAAVHIPANPEYSSLNLAAAVQVLAYEVRLAWLAAQSQTMVQEAQSREAPASHAQLESFFAQLGQTLDDIDFHKGRSPDSAMRKLRRLFLRTDLSERELRLLRGVLADAQRMARLAMKS